MWFRLLLLEDAILKCFAIKQLVRTAHLRSYWLYVAPEPKGVWHPDLKGYVVKCNQGQWRDATFFCVPFIFLSRKGLKFERQYIVFEDQVHRPSQKLLSRNSCSWRWDCLTFWLVMQSKETCCHILHSVDVNVALSVLSRRSMAMMTCRCFRPGYHWWVQSVRVCVCVCVCVCACACKLQVVTKLSMLGG